MGILGDLADSVTGNVETAYLVVDDYRALCRANQNQGGTGVQKGAAAALTGGAAATKSTSAKKDTKYFKVQFNPAQFQLNAAVTQETKLDAQSGGTEGRRTVADAHQKPTITLSVALLFDDTNLSDAFMGEQFTVGAGAIATLATNAVSAAATIRGKRWSVQPQVEALLAALRNSYTRFLTFYWADFAFAGQLTAVSAQYTMFSTSGRPIRATVNLRMRQELDPEHLNTWYREFTDSFGASIRLSGAAQAVGNVLNLNL